MTDLDSALALWGPPQQPGEQEGLFAKDERPKALAFGDSWLAIPRNMLAFGPPANITACLRAGGRWNVKALVENGAELVAMLAGEWKHEFLEALDRDPYDVIVFSGGGNDFVGAWDFPSFIMDRRDVGFMWGGRPIEQVAFLHEDRFLRRLQQAKLALQDMIDFVRASKLNRRTPIITHSYDFVIPRPEGATFLHGTIKYQGGRSWLHPYFMAKGWTDQKEQQAIAKAILLRFKEMQQEVADSSGGQLHLVDTQGTLGVDQYRDEIHPTPEGFQAITAKIEAKMLELVPEAREAAQGAVEAQAIDDVEAEGTSQPAPLGGKTAAMLEAETLVPAEPSWLQHLQQLGAPRQAPRQAPRPSISAATDALLATFKADAERQVAEARRETRLETIEEYRGKMEALLRAKRRLAHDRVDDLLTELPEVFKP